MAAWKVRTLTASDRSDLLQALAGEGWTRQGACRKLRWLGPWLFFGDEGERKPDREERQRIAKAFCRGCPVRQECLNAASIRREQHGIWGGVEFPGEWRAQRRLARRGADSDESGEWDDPAA